MSDKMTLDELLTHIDDMIAQHGPRTCNYERGCLIAYRYIKQYIRDHRAELEAGMRPTLNERAERHMEMNHKAGIWLLEELLEQGWRDAKDDPPDTDREVQIAWNDGSHGKATGFYDGTQSEPDNKVWWSQQRLEPLGDGAVIAWREMYI